MAELKVVAHVAELPAAAWDACAQAPHEASAWYRACEATWPDLRFRYLAQYEAGQLAAVLPLHAPAGRHGLHPIRVYDARLSKWARLFLRCAAIGSPLTLSSRPAGCPADPAALWAAAADAARALGCDTLLAPFLAQPDKGLGLRIRPALPEFELALPGTSFEDYLASFNARRRWNLRNEMRSVAHLQFSVQPLAGYEQEMARLQGLNRARYRVQDAGEERFYRALVQEFGADAQVVLARDCGRIIGMAMLLRRGDAIWVLHTGSEARDRTYFSLVFYEPIRWAYAQGLRRINLRRAAGHGKMLRGAVPLPGWAGLRDLTWRSRTLLRLVEQPPAAVTWAGAT